MRIFYLFIFSCLHLFVYSQDSLYLNKSNKKSEVFALKSIDSITFKKISDYKLEQQSNVVTNEDGSVVISSNVNPNWSDWKYFNYGIETARCPVPIKIDGPLISNGTIMVGGKNTKNMRWGLHFLEGWNKDLTQRFTAIVNKHSNYAELYYYLKGGEAVGSYGYTRIGSDVNMHSFAFTRDEMLAYGLIDCKSVLNFARIDPSKDLNIVTDVNEADNKYNIESEDHAKAIRYLQLKNAKDGATFYDVSRKKIVVKIGGNWCDVNVTIVEKDTYKF